MLRFSALIHRIFGSVNRVSSDTLAHPRTPVFSVLSSFFHRPSSSCPLRLALFLSRSLVTPLPFPSLYRTFSFRYSVSVTASLPRTRIFCRSLFLRLVASLYLPRTRKGPSAPLCIPPSFWTLCFRLFAAFVAPCGSSLNSQSFDSSSLRILFLVHRFLIPPFSSLLQ